MGHVGVLCPLHLGLGRPVVLPVEATLVLKLHFGVGVLKNTDSVLGSALGLGHLLSRLGLAESLVHVVLVVTN